MSAKLNDRGSISLIVICSMVALVGLGALVLDGGQLYYQKARLETAVDAAVLAGAMSLKNGAQAAKAAALQAAQLNGVGPSEIEVDVDTIAKRVTAKAKRSVDFGLARILKLQEADVHANSQAGTLSISGTQGVVPLGVVWQDFVFGQLYHLKMGDGTTGNYGALALGGTGAANYRANLINGYPGWVEVGDLFPTETGNMSNPTKVAVDERIAGCNHHPACTHAHFASGCSRLVIVPIISHIPNGRGEVTILGFGAFFLEGVAGQGKDNYVSGRFIEMYIKGKTGPAGYYGVQAIKLLR